MSRRLSTAVPKPRRKPKAKAWSSIAPKSYEAKLEAAAKLRSKSKKKRVARKRKPSEFARIYGGSYADYIRSLPCLVNLLCLGVVQAHHTKTGGMGMKADARTLVPLCARHHDQLHTGGCRSFEKAWGLDLELAADRCWSAWEDFCEKPLAPLSVPEHR